MDANSIEGFILMKRAWIRSSVFNLCFYAWTLLLCFVALPFLLLPRPAFIWFVKFYLKAIHIFEKIILGLNYEVRGLENLPKDGSYIIAAKHMSPYETFKLHLLLNDPAVILKKELLSIPLWGWYLKKADVIAIDRSTPSKAIKSMKEGARKVQEQGRPIVIFPQGTRVRPDETAKDKPYKPGITRVQDATGLPIIPMALNTGVFWPRSGWGKSPGTAVFEFLKPIKSAKNRKTLLARLEKTIEKRSHILIKEAQASSKKEGSVLKHMAVMAVILFGAYTALWFGSAYILKTEYIRALDSEKNITRLSSEPVVRGYPGNMTLSVKKEYIVIPQGAVDMRGVTVKAWPLPLPFTPIDIHARVTNIKQKRWRAPLEFERFRARVSYGSGVLKIHSALFEKEAFQARLYGEIDPTQMPVAINGTLLMERPHVLVSALTRSGIIDTRSALLAAAGLMSFTDTENGVAEIPIYQKKGTLYAGMFPIYKMSREKRSMRRQRIRPVSPLSP